MGCNGLQLLFSAWSNTECGQTMRLDDGTRWHFQSSKDMKARGWSHDLRPAGWSNRASEPERFALFGICWVLGSNISAEAGASGSTAAVTAPAPPPTQSAHLATPVA